MQLAEGPNSVSERRVRTPVRQAPVKREIGVHDEEPDTKKNIVDDDEDMPDDPAELSAVQARREDEDIICKAM